ncbi:hypothetical protein AVEN_25034-1 [Araneus ventricosus]|uniref:Uncharacterized protein n=1 Tax=Araneus ventricosus TaxID=182803 RepID=A0A4Y2W023_ARAVE|nr:hypothetical protein AVEN_25034-1 [Araneus ventricosus]
MDSHEVVILFNYPRTSLNQSQFINGKQATYQIRDEIWFFHSYVYSIQKLGGFSFEGNSVRSLPVDSSNPDQLLHHFMQQKSKPMKLTSCIGNLGIERTARDCSELRLTVLISQSLATAQRSPGGTFRYSMER